MNEFKNIMIGAIFGVCLFADVNAYPYVSDVKDIIIRDENDAKEISQHNHDWECKYIIEDNYHSTVRYHYVDNYIRNVDASISFIGEDGLVWRIPAPYYWIYKNEKNSH